MQCQRALCNSFAVYYFCNMPWSLIIYFNNIQGVQQTTEVWDRFFLFPIQPEFMILIQSLGHEIFILFYHLKYAMVIGRKTHQYCLIFMVLRHFEFKTIFTLDTNTPQIYPVLISPRNTNSVTKLKRYHILYIKNNFTKFH